jgi:type IV pilus assembly protein PilB
MASFSAQNDQQDSVQVPPNQATTMDVAVPQVSPVAATEVPMEDLESAAKNLEAQLAQVDTSAPQVQTASADSHVPLAPVQSDGQAAPSIDLPLATSQSASGDAQNSGDSSPDSIITSPAAELVKQGIMSQDQLLAVQAESVTTGKKLDDLLLEKNLATEEQIAQAKASYYNVPFIRLADTTISPEALNLLPEGVAKRYYVVPFGVDKTEMSINLAMANPLDLRTIDFIEKKTGYHVIPSLATLSDIEATISDRYAQSLSSEVSQALKDSDTQRVNVVDVKQLGEVIREAPIAKIVETILTFAMKSLASDVHIEPQEEKTRIRYRIDGILYEKLVLPRGVQDAVVSRIKILSNLKIDEKRLPQDGRFSFRIGGEEVDLRVSTLPTVHGEKVVMRLLKKTQKVPTLPELGLRGMALKHLQTAVSVPHGIILVTGPTGSGKTTTLYSILSRLNTPQVNIVTLEDPVEYEIKGVNQVQIHNQAGLSFASGLRSFLRQDPNIIMVGEIRDQETADLAVQAALTGHLVFSTLHTNSAAGALPRLLDMGIEPYLLASSITCVVGQRVVRKISDDARVAYKPETPVITEMEQTLGPLFNAFLQQKGITKQQIELYKSQAPAGTGTGYSGRIGIFEVLPITEKIGRMLLERTPAIDIENAAVADGMILMKQDGYLKALEGATTLEEVLRVAETVTL